MNALELANNILADNCVLINSDKIIIATMLRQQQSEIESLKGEVKQWEEWKESLNGWSKK